MWYLESLIQPIILPLCWGSMRHTQRGVPGRHPYLTYVRLSTKCSYTQILVPRSFNQSVVGCRSKCIMTFCLRIITHFFFNNPLYHAFPFFLKKVFMAQKTLNLLQNRPLVRSSLHQWKVLPTTQWKAHFHRAASGSRKQKKNAVKIIMLSKNKQDQL